MIIKLTKIKNKDKILKTTREKWQITYKETPIGLPADFSTETHKTKGNNMIYLKWWKGRKYNQEYSTQQDSHSDLIEKSQKLSRQAREFSTIKPVLQQMLKELL